MLKGFKQFILRGKAVDLAVGVVVGAAFTGMVNALVKDLVTPLISAIIKAPDFSGLHFVINGSKFMFGDLLNALISFIIISAVVYFFVVTPVNILVARSKKGEEPIDAESKKCPECLSEIPMMAKRCAFCTVELPEPMPVENV